jgi:hypothetical protein
MDSATVPEIADLAMVNHHDGRFGKDSSWPHRIGVLSYLLAQDEWL